MNTKFQPEHKMELLKINTPQQIDVVLYDVIKNHNEQELLRLVSKQCYPVSAFVLNLLLDFEQEHLITKVIEESQYLNYNIYDWLVVYLGEEEAEDYLCNILNESTILDKVSDEALVRNKKWHVLQRVEHWSVLAEHGRAEYIDFKKVFDLRDNLTKIVLINEVLKQGQIALLKDYYSDLCAIRNRINNPKCFYDNGYKGKLDAAYEALRKLL